MQEQKTIQKTETSVKISTKKIAYKYPIKQSLITNYGANHSEARDQLITILGISYETFTNDSKMLATSTNTIPAARLFMYKMLLGW
jgi:hypothetical protein